MKDIPFIITEIVLKAALQDAKYDHHEEVVIGENGSSFVLVEE